MGRKCQGICGWNAEETCSGNRWGRTAEEGLFAILWFDPEVPEIRSHLAQINGATAEVAAVEAADVPAFLAARRKEGRVPILVGAVALGQVGTALAGRGDRDGSFALQVTPDAIAVAGIGEGTLFGAYELLEQMGVRWFMPGRLGTVLPATNDAAVPVGTTVQSPSFPARHFQMGFPEWQQRLRCGGRNFPSCHGLPGLSGELFRTHPEYFALVNGRRTANQVCVSNPEVVTIVTEAVRAHFRAAPESWVVGMGANDGSGFCECAECRALDAGDWDPFSGERSVTDRYIWFFNQVLAGIQSEFPDKKIGFYIYHTYMRPPVTIKPDPRITGALAPIALCRVHGPNNPVCPEGGYYQWLMEEWGRQIPEVWERGYWSNLACPGLPFINVHRLREQIPLARKAGIQGWRVETFHHWGTQVPSFYIAGKLMWNAEADVDALLDDFAQKFFGPAAEPMGRYVRLMDGALRDADFHTGCSWDMPHFYPAPVRKEARALLERAKKKAGRGIYDERVQMIGETLDYLDAFIEMMEARAGGDLVAAQKALDRVDAVQAKLLAYDPPMVDPRFAKSYMDRFYRGGTEQGYRRVTGGNRPAALLRDEWQFLLDSSKVGEDLGWWKDGARGGNWQPIRTCSLSWSDQGLRYYKGLAWYRQTVRIPAEFKGPRVFLWCGGVDEKAKVWVNGQAIGISHGASFLPFEMDATAAIRPGADNTVVFCVANNIVDELGTGGIVAPVLFYAPAGGAAAVLENVLAPAPTFP